MGSYATDIRIVTDKPNLAEFPCDVMVVPVFQQDAPAGAELPEDTEEKEKSKKVPRWVELHASLDDMMSGHLLATLSEERFKADCGKKRIFKLRAPDGIQAKWIVVLGLGEPDKLDIKKLTQAFQGSWKETFSYKEVHDVAVLMPVDTKKVSVRHAVQAACIAAFQSTYKTREAGESKIHAFQSLSLIMSEGTSVHEKDVEAARAMGMAEALTKDLANMPANLKTAETLAETARSFMGLPGISVEIIDDVGRIAKEMPAFFAVAAASAKSDPPRFIKVHYKPSGGTVSKKIALVGKGVIFDTGGVQVKTGNYMNDMKFDMTGAASVLAIMKAVSEMALQGVEISAYVAATRNAISDTAYLPDSILDSASGKKIEIRHTDAEGRVTLADAVYKASLDKPDEMVTVATLTGSAGVAVGHSIALMGTDEDLVRRVETAARDVGESVQSFELLEEDFDNIKSERDAADLSNTSKSKSRGHLSAGAFVMSFGQDIPMAHLDIAGGDAKDGNATGIAVKGLIQYLRNEAS